MNFLIIVTSVETYLNKNLKTGLWLSELTHLYHSAEEQGYEITIASPKGGNTPLDPESLKPMMLDKITKVYYKDNNFMNLLKHSKTLEEVENDVFDVVYLAGGHGTMYDFPDNMTLQNIIRKHYENDKVISAICHGLCGLLNVKLSSGEYLLKNKTITGFTWLEESLARRRKEVPFNLEKELKKRETNYRKSWIPMTSKVVVEGNLITGQNPFSSKEMAKAVINQVKKK